MVLPPEDRDFEAVHRAAARRDLPRLLGMLERLDGAEEADVVRGAVQAGVAYDLALSEVQREVERRLARLLGGEDAGGAAY
jgi:FixJ family two-component response regulator